MPALSFSGETSQGPFWKQILDNKKTQTCRRPRKKYSIQPGQIVTLYWKQRVPIRRKPIHKIGTAQVTSVERKRYREFAFDDEFARRDGFKDSSEMREWFGNPSIYGDEIYDVIRWPKLLHPKLEHHPLAFSKDERYSKYYRS